LRRNGYIDKLYNVPTTTIDNKLSMTERKNWLIVYIYIEK
jgi:hypothetical protein